MTAERIHHPACAARWGGLCTSCPPTPKQPTEPTPADLSCSACGTTYIATGETPEKRAAAIAAWDGCECTQTPVVAVGEAPATTGHNLLGRLLSGRPAWVVRRAGVAW